MPERGVCPKCRTPNNTTRRCSFCGARLEANVKTEYKTNARSTASIRERIGVLEARLHDTIFPTTITDELRRLKNQLRAGKAAKTRKKRRSWKYAVRRDRTLGQTRQSAPRCVKRRIPMKDAAWVPPHLRKLKKLRKENRAYKRLHTQLLDLLGQFCGETGKTEGAVETLQRLVAEVEAAREKAKPKKTCARCEGSGRIKIAGFVPDLCPACMGEGKVTA